MNRIPKALSSFYLKETLWPRRLMTYTIRTEPVAAQAVSVQFEGGICHSTLPFYPTMGEGEPISERHC